MHYYISKEHHAFWRCPAIPGIPAITIRVVWFLYREYGAGAVWMRGTGTATTATATAKETPAGPMIETLCTRAQIS